MDIKSLLEADYRSGTIGQATHTFPIPLKEDAYRIASFLQSPKDGWHSKVESGEDGQWHVTVVVNVDPKKLK